MSSQNPEKPETTETGGGGGYGEPSPEQELGQKPGEQASHAQQGKPSQGGEEGQEGRPDQATASEERAGEQQDPVTGESLRPGQAESPG
ncbi:hypothetical protein J2W21_000531 [Sinomonas atrocyanea]|uniref:hypothetical protein n=1 Tax=Sinomonas atrocyanea TaxID=37927 RepID=UPI00278AA006|nr:hypothetical protein [Sinomonas atrocyanea]MDP9883052.1 hypothetical protein [Sinomonas atrocyanea]